MNNKTRNREYLKNYLDIVKNKMDETIDGKSISYMIKKILNSDGPMEDCFGFASLDEYLKQQQRIEKIEYIRQHMDVLDMNMMEMLGKTNVLYAIKEILISDKPLKKCQGYKLLNQYIEKNEWLQESKGKTNQSKKSQVNTDCQKELKLLHMLSSIVSAVNRGQDMNQVNQLTSFYQCVGKGQDTKGYQKQMASIA